MTAPQLGDFEVVHVGGYGGKLIRIGQILNGSGFEDYEHARLYVGDGRCVEADPGGARIVAYDPNDGGLWSTDYIKLTNDGGLWSTDYIKLTDEERQIIAKAGIGYAKAHIGYSGLDYGALVAHRLHVPVPGLRDYIQSSGHMICSQLVDMCYQDAKVQLFNDGRWAGYVTPGDLTELITHHYG